MHSSRRDFIKSVGISIASLVMARCIPLQGQSDSARNRLRECWLKLNWLAQESQRGYEQGEKAREQLVSDHDNALEKIHALGEIDSATVEQLQVAFKEAAHHVWASYAPIECYVTVSLSSTDFYPTSVNQLREQIDLLAEISKGNDLDPITVSQVQTAIERDIAFLNLSDEDTQMLYNELLSTAGDSHSFPTFDELELEIPPESMEATRFLVDLMLESR
jgi:DNA repair ATPase RecN